jgi:hypothetical protein
MRYTCEACRFRIFSFFTALECSRERAYDKMPGSDPVEILGVLSENSEFMLLKFYLDLNEASHHKHALSVTLEWV